MATSSALIEGAYLRDLLEQAASLRRTHAMPLPDGLSRIAHRLNGPLPPILILTGMGSSFHALHPLAVRLAEAGIRALMLETSELIYYWTSLLGPSCVVIAVSQSGRSAEMLRLLELNQLKDRRFTLIGVTNDPQSPLALESDSVTLIAAGEESSVSCKTYLCTLLALSRIADVLCSGLTAQPGGDRGALADEVERYIAQWREHVATAQEFLQGTNYIVLAGRGSSLATAGTGGLILKEAAHFPAEGMSAAAFRHGPLEMVGNSLFLLVFEGDLRASPLNRGLVAAVTELGGRAQLVSGYHPDPLFRIASTSDALRPILEILPVQMISLALAARDGREAGAFAHASKITSVE